MTAILPVAEARFEDWLEALFDERMVPAHSARNKGWQQQERVPSGDHGGEFGPASGGGERPATLGDAREATRLMTERLFTYGALADALGGPDREADVRVIPVDVHSPTVAVAFKIRTQQRLEAALAGNPEFAALASSMSALVIESSTTPVAKLIGGWAGTSADSDSHAIAMQLAVERQFGIEDAAHPWTATERTGPTASLYPTREDAANRVLDENPGGREAFVKAMYDTTQKELADRGIEGMYLYRGMQDQTGQPLAGEGEPGYVRPETQFSRIDGTVRLQPMSSFSLDMGTAASFAGSSGDPARLIAAWVPASRILSFPGTGFGCLSETEVVVLGGPIKASSVSWHEYGISANATAQAALFKPDPRLATKALASLPSPDADLVNADWPKRTWDLPIDPEEFHALCPDGIDPDWPAAQAMPPYLRRGLAAAGYPSIQKGWQEQPRVPSGEHGGEFGSTDGGFAGGHRLDIGPTFARGATARMAEKLFPAPDDSYESGWTNVIESQDIAVEYKVATMTRLAGQLRDSEPFNKLADYANDQSGTVRADAYDRRNYAVKDLIGSWAATSGDHDGGAIALQLAAEEQLGVQGAAHPWDSGDRGRYMSTLAATLEEYEQAEGARAAFIQTMYDTTQADLKAKGIDGMYLYRGSGYADMMAGDEQLYGNTPVRTEDTVRLQPMSSFSLSVETAMNFAGSHGQYARIDAAWVPAARILSYPGTGFGCLSETEVVVLGGQMRTTTVSWDTRTYLPFVEALDPRDVLFDWSGAKKAAGRDTLTSLDAELHNADWPKTAWDLPRDPEEFHQFYPAGIDPALPVADAMPEYLRAGLEAASYPAVQGAATDPLGDAGAIHGLPDTSNKAGQYRVPSGPHGGEFGSADGEWADPGTRAAENSLAGRDIETGMVFTPAGKLVVERTGTKAHVGGFAPDQVVGNLMLHNHPGSGPWSMRDLLVLHDDHAAEIRLVTGEYVHSMRIGSGETRNYGRLVEAWTSATSFAEKDRIKALPGSLPERQAIYADSVSRTVAAAMGWEYRRRPLDASKIDQARVPAGDPHGGEFGVSRGGEVSSSARAKLTARIAEIAAMPHEVLLIHDASGRILLDKAGEHAQVGMTPSEVKLAKGNVVIHNHPVGGWSAAQIRENPQLKLDLPYANGPGLDDGLAARICQSSDAIVVGKGGVEYHLAVDQTISIRELSNAFDRTQDEVQTAAGLRLAEYRKQLLATSSDAAGFTRAWSKEFARESSDIFHNVWTKLAGEFPASIHYRRVLP